VRNLALIGDHLQLQPFTAVSDRANSDVVATHSRTGSLLERAVEVRTLYHIAYRDISRTAQRCVLLSVCAMIRMPAVSVLSTHLHLSAYY
jgi:hypothetical protein